MRIFLFLVFALTLATPALAAIPDDNVEWDGVSHLPNLDRDPACPVGGESFTVYFQTWQNDITAARLSVDDGAAQWITAGQVGTDGPYDVWAGQIPATANGTLSYWIELTDGTDTDFYGPTGMATTAPATGFELDFVTLLHAPVGATQVTGGSVFRVWAPTRTTVHVRGDFNGWGLGNPMTQQGEHFIGFVPGTADRQMYKYFFNNAVWNTDARARSLNPSNNLNSHLEDPGRYVWQIPDFDTPELPEMVIYQLHVGTFAGFNDPMGSTQFPSRYLDVAQRAGHLAELGINAVMLNPVTEFAGDISVGYNPLSMWAPEWKYGNPDDLRAMVDALHAQGIAVLLDIIWNHFSTTDNYLWFYDGSQTYYDDPAVETPWGAQADFDEPEVRSYFLESVGVWLDEFNLDGFRMDATSAMNVAPQDASGWSLMQEFNDLVDNRWADKVVIAEQLPDNDWVTRPTSLGGAGFDAQYYDAFTDQLRQEILDAAFGDPEMWRIRNIINGSGQYLSGPRVVNYLELHDEAWPESGGERMVQTIDPSAPHDDEWAQGRIKLGQGVVLTAPGTPAILQGSEWLEDINFGANFGDRIDWSHKTTYAPTFAYFRDLITLRTGNPALRSDASSLVTRMDEGRNVIGYVRSDGNGNSMLVIANFSNNDYADLRFGVPETGNWDEAINSQSAAYGGTDATNPGFLGAETVGADGYPQSLVLQVPKMGLLVLRWLGPGTPVEDPIRTRVAFALDPISPNPLRALGQVRFRVPGNLPVRLEVFDARGRRIAVLADQDVAEGEHIRMWDTRGLASGVYFVRMSSGTTRLTRRAIVVR